MPHTSEHHSHPWTSLITALGLVIAAMLIWLALRGAQEAGHTLKLTLREAAPSLPSLPRLPEGPKLPAAPIPMPK